MKKLLCVVLVIYFQPVLAQQDVIDSLKKSIQTLPNDTNRVLTLNDLAYRVMFSHPQQGDEYAERAASLASQLQFDRGFANAQILIGMSHDLRGKYELSIAAYEKGLHVLDEPKEKKGRSFMALHNGLGLTYSRKGDHPKALESLLISLESAKLDNNQPAVVSVMLNIGNVYLDQKEYSKALEYYRKCKELAIAQGKNEYVSRANNNIGIVYRDTGLYDEAIEYFSISLNEKKRLNDTLGISKSLNNLASAYWKKGDFKIALSHLAEAEVLKIKVEDKWGLVEVNDTRASIYMQQNRLNEAERLIKSNLILVNELDGANKELVYERFYDLYKKKNDYKNAMAWYERKTVYRDSIFNESKSRQLAELQTLYELNNKEKEIIELEKEMDAEHSAKNIMILLLISVGIVSIGVLGFLRFRAKKKQQLFEVELELQSKEIENASLREGELKREIAFKNRELASYTINFVQKSELIEELRRNLNAIQPENAEVARKIAGIHKIVESSYQVDREWEDFKTQFENVHHDFFRILKERCPELTNGDLKLCALLKLNMNMKEAAKVLGISPESVKTARYRLRKKFGMTQDENLVDFILNIDNELSSGRSIAMSA